MHMAAYDQDNIFAKVLKGEIPCHKLYEDEDTLVFLDIMPRTEGHTLVITKEPAPDLFGITPEGLGKLDLDLEMPPRYFETMIERMKANPRLGTCSGKAYYRDPRTGSFVSERIGDEMSVGAAKFYRTECFQQIGSFVRAIM